MNKDNAHLYIPLLAAFSEGKTIECNLGTSEHGQTWQPCEKEEAA